MMILPGEGRGKSRMTQVSDLSNWEAGVDGALFCHECRGRNRFWDEGLFKFGPVLCLFIPFPRDTALWKQTITIPTLVA